MIEQVADRLAVSLETARLLEVTQRTAQRERRIGELTRRIRESLAVDDVLERSAREIREAMDLFRVAVRLAPGHTMAEAPAAAVAEGESVGGRHRSTGGQHRSQDQGTTDSLSRSVDVTDTSEDVPNSLGDVPNSLGDAPKELGGVPNSLGDAPDASGDTAEGCGDTPGGSDAPDTSGDTTDSHGVVL
jgi:hypothetical protein